MPFLNATLLAAPLAGCYHHEEIGPCHESFLNDRERRVNMPKPVIFDQEPQSNAVRQRIADEEPISLRTYTPSMAVIARSAGLYHWTPEGRQLADFTSGVLVANLGHNPVQWLRRLLAHMGWHHLLSATEGYAPFPPLTAYNAITPMEEEATSKLLASVRATPHGSNLEQVIWAASGSEAVQKSLWSSLSFQPTKDIILATRNGFHGKKGLSEAVTGDENSPNRDPRVVFISFPKTECDDIDRRDDPFDPAPYLNELNDLAEKHAGRLNCLITEPYLGGGGSFHPPPAYLQLLGDFCRRHQLTFILDEVQSNFGRTGRMYAFERYGITPDIVALGKGMGNGIPVNAAVGRRDIFASMGYGGTSDTWSGHPLGCAAVLATLEEFEYEQVLARLPPIIAIVEKGLRRLKQLPIVRAVRGEGMVWGIELQGRGGRDAASVATECVRVAYQGDAEGNAIHLLGPLAGKVIRVSPPLTITEDEAELWMDVLFQLFAKVDRQLADASSAAEAGQPA